MLAGGYTVELECKVAPALDRFFPRRGASVAVAGSARESVNIGMMEGYGPDPGSTTLLALRTALKAFAECRDSAEIAEAIGLLEEFKARLLVKSVVAELGAKPSESTHPEDQLLTVDEAAQVLGQTTKWLYRHADKLPFTRRLSRRNLRFSKLGLQKYVARKRS